MSTNEGGILLSTVLQVFILWDEQMIVLPCPQFSTDLFSCPALSCLLTYSTAMSYCLQTHASCPVMLCACTMILALPCVVCLYTTLTAHNTDTDKIFY